MSRNHIQGAYLFGCTCVTQVGEKALIEAHVCDTFLACSCLGRLQSFWLFVYLGNSCARGYTRALRRAIDKVYCVDVSRWKSQAPSPRRYRF